MYQILGLLLKNRDLEDPLMYTYIGLHTNRHTQDRKTRETLLNRNTSPGTVLVSKQYRFVKQCRLVNITGLYKVQVSGKIPVTPFVSINMKLIFLYWHFAKILKDPASFISSKILILIFNSVVTCFIKFLCRHQKMEDGIFLYNLVFLN